MLKIYVTNFRRAFSLYNEIMAYALCPHMKNIESKTRANGDNGKKNGDSVGNDRRFYTCFNII